MSQTARLKLQALLAARNTAKTPPASPPESQETNPVPQALETTDRYGKSITYNAKQSQFVSLASSGKSCILIGAAGTGKTTCMKGVTQALIESGAAGILSPEGHKHLKPDTPGILICAYTRRAVSNIRKNLPLDLQSNCITIHKALEFAPTYVDVTDPKSGKVKTTRQFKPQRNAENPLPSSIRIIIYEESSMIGTDLYRMLQDALAHPVQEIFLGDIQQLPPVFGPAILGFKLLSLPVVELTEVYRQALESPIIRLAHRILSGNPIPSSEFPTDWKIPLQLTLHPWKKKIDPIEAVNTLGQFFKVAHENNAYDPEQDIILTPYNKGFGTLEINAKIANYLARKRQAVTFEVIAGFSKLYFSIGDKVMYEKEDAVIVDIYPNPAYSGIPPQKESSTLDYWGHNSEATQAAEKSDSDIDFLLAQVAANESKDEDRVHQASHIIVVQFGTSQSLDTDLEPIRISKASEINNLLLGYALTVHKSQGSEFRKVFFCMHHSQNAMISRELLYTGVTRAREELYVICEPDTFVKGINSQRIKGNTLEEKAEQFKGRPQAEEFA